MPHLKITWSQFREYVVKISPTIEAIVLITQTKLDDELLAAIKPIAQATTPDGVDWSKIREASQGVVGLLEFVASRTPPTWDDDVVKVLHDLVQHRHNPPVFAPE